MSRLGGLRGVGIHARHSEMEQPSADVPTRKSFVSDQSALRVPLHMIQNAHTNIHTRHTRAHTQSQHTYVHTGTPAFFLATNVSYSSCSIIISLQGRELLVLWQNPSSQLRSPTSALWLKNANKRGDSQQIQMS